MTVSPSGFAPKTLHDIRSDLRAAVAASPVFGPSAQTGPDTILGQLLDVFAADLSDAWSALQALYDARDPDAATGAQLDRLTALVGVIREAEAYSRVFVTFTAGDGNAGTIPVGFRVRIDGGALFETIESAAFAAPPGLTFDYVLLCEATAPGAIEAPIGSIDTLVSSVLGVLACTNAAAAIPGQLRQIDADLRRTREASLVALGAASDAAIRTSLLQRVDVIDAVAVSNRTDAPIAGIRPRAVRAIVWPDTLDAASVHTTLERVLPAGIFAEGAEREGDSAFDFAARIEVTLELTLTTDAEYPADGDALCIAAMQAFVDGLLIGQDVYTVRVIAAVLAAVDGITSAALTLNGVAATLVVSYDSIARFLSATVV